MSNAYNKMLSFYIIDMFNYITNVLKPKGSTFSQY